MRLDLGLQGLKFTFFLLDGYDIFLSDGLFQFLYGIIQLITQII